MTNLPHASLTRWVVATTITLGVLCVGIYLGWFILRPFILTPLYADELMPAVRRYFERTNTSKGWTDPNILRQVATGKALDWLIQTRCVGCSRIEITTGTHIAELQILDYSGSWSKVGVRVESAWHLVDTNDGTILGPCHAQAYSEVLLLRRESGVWKVADGADAPGWERNAIDDSPELRAKYCPLN